MSNKTNLKAFFNTGDTPTETHYHDVIDSQLNTVETTSQTVAGPVVYTLAITASSNISSSGTIIAAAYSGSITSTGSFANVVIQDKVSATGPQKLVANAQIVDVNEDLTLSAASHHAKYITVGGEYTMTLPAVAIGVSFCIINGQADGNAITVSPNSADRFLYDIAGAAGTEDKDIILTKETSKTGDFVRLLGLTADGWAITEISGVWIDES